MPTDLVRHLLVGAIGAAVPAILHFAAGFDCIDAPRLVTHYEQGYPVATWTLLVCRGFHGFPSRPRHGTRAHF